MSVFAELSSLVVVVIYYLNEDYHIWLKKKTKSNSVLKDLNKKCQQPEENHHDINCPCFKFYLALVNYELIV